MNFGTHGHIYLAEKVEKWCYCGNTTILSEETTKMYTKKKKGRKYFENFAHRNNDILF